MPKFAGTVKNFAEMCFQNFPAGLNLCSSLEVPNTRNCPCLKCCCLQSPALCLGLLAFLPKLSKNIAYMLCKLLEK